MPHKKHVAYLKLWYWCVDGCNDHLVSLPDIRLYLFLGTGMCLYRYVYFGPCSVQADACMAADESKDRRVWPPPCMASTCSQNKNIEMFSCLKAASFS